MQKTKYALVLSGGGFKGAFQLGALNYLKDHWTT
ncbi:MAG: patatin-like phospholipase family protein, partial [Dinghuibacter sp.]|nr:patatin-like phospholipase family protein [Dinghuibacter sp.]